MAEKLDKLVKAAGDVAASAVKATGQLVHKGYDKASQLATKAKISKMHRQLGLLAYTQRKTGQQNNTMMQWYVEEIDRLKAELPQEICWEKEVDDMGQSDVNVFGKKDAEDGEDAMFCCGSCDESP